MQGAFAVVPEGRVAEVVRETHGLDQIRVGAVGQRNTLGDLRDFERVGEPRPKEVPFVDAEHLRLALQTAERRGMDDPRAVVLELRAPVGRGACRLRRMAGRVRGAGGGYGVHSSKAVNGSLHKGMGSGICIP